MAEIKIEKKKPIWPWVLIILLIIAAAAYFLLVENNDSDDIDDYDTEEFQEVRSDNEL